MSDLSTEIYSSIRVIGKEVGQKKFLSKMLLLFGIYLISNYIFDMIDREDLIRTFHSNPYITIKLPNNTTWKIIISLGMIVLSHYTYTYLIKPFFYQMD